MSSEGKPDLREFAGHIRYEIGMLRFTFKKLLEYKQLGTLTSSQKMFHNAVLESFLLHVRNLRQFLTNSKSRPDDIIAIDFTEDEMGGTDISNTVSEAIDDSELKRIHKMLAHISYMRLDLPKSWPIGKYHSGLFMALERFYNSLPDDKSTLFMIEDFDYDGQGPEIVEGTWATY
jgi:hypothetical protein